MKFKKIVLVGISESSLGQQYWDRIFNLTDSKIFLPKESPDIKKELADADCLLVGFGISVTKEDIDSSPNLKYIGVLATAFGKIDTAYAKEKGIPVCNLAGYSTESVAEFTFAAILDIIRAVEEGKTRGRSGNYSEDGLSATEIKGKVFGILGLGNIGGRVAEIALGFSANVKYWSRNKKPELEKKGVAFEEIDALIPQCDFLSINLAETPETRGVLNEQRFNSLKSGVIIINTAPMELIDLDGLEERLKKGDITFIFDHSDEFAPEYMARFSKYKNFIIYPPIAYITKEAAQTKQEMFASNIEALLTGSPVNVVN